jgi:hypothetical protein
MMNLTGEFPAVTLSDRAVMAHRTNTSKTSASVTRELLTGAAKSLHFHLTFANDVRLLITLAKSGTEPAWHWRVFSTLQELASLRPGWDSYNAATLSPVAVARCIKTLLPVLPGEALEPSVVPTRDGGLQLEWHSNGVDFEIKVPPTGPVSYLLVRPGTDQTEEWEGPPARYARAIEEAIRRLMPQA